MPDDGNCFQFSILINIADSSLDYEYYTYAYILKHFYIYFPYFAYALAKHFCGILLFIFCQNNIKKVDYRLLIMFYNILSNINKEMPA